MSMSERGRSWLWASVVAVALILLAGIMTAVIIMSARLRRPERQIVIQRVPITARQGTTPSALPPTHSARPDSARSAPKPPALEVNHGQPVRVVEKPVKVIEKQVKVIEREIRVVEKPVRGAATTGPAGGQARPDDRFDRPSGTFRATGLPDQLDYNGKRWNATDLVRGLPSDLIMADRTGAEGWQVYHDQDAEQPYRHIYLKVRRQRDQYVRYVPTTP